MSNIRPKVYITVPAYSPPEGMFPDTRFLEFPRYCYKVVKGMPESVDYHKLLQYLGLEFRDPLSDIIYFAVRRRNKDAATDSPAAPESPPTSEEIARYASQHCVDCTYEFSYILGRFVARMQYLSNDDRANSLNYNYIQRIHIQLLNIAMKKQIIKNRVEDPCHLPEISATVRRKGNYTYYYDDSNILALTHHVDTPMTHGQVSLLEEEDVPEEVVEPYLQTLTSTPISPRESLQLFGGIDPESNIHYSALLQDIIPNILKYCMLNDSISAYRLMRTNKTMRYLLEQDSTCFPLKGGRLLFGNQMLIYEWMVHRATMLSRGGPPPELKIPKKYRRSYWFNRLGTTMVHVPSNAEATAHLMKVSAGWKNCFVVSAPTGTGKTLSMLMAAETTTSLESHLYDSCNRTIFRHHEAFNMVTQNMTVDTAGVKEYFGNRGKPVDKVLIIAPPTVGCGVYRNEYQKFFPHRNDMKLLYGTEFVKGEDYSKYKYIIVSANAFGGKGEISDELRRIHNFRMVIVDEFHYGNAKMVDFLANAISYDTIFLMSATPPDTAYSKKDYEGKTSSFSRYMKMMGFGEDIGAGLDILKANLPLLSLECLDNSVKAINFFHTHTKTFSTIQNEVVKDRISDQLYNAMITHPLARAIHLSEVFLTEINTNINLYNEKNGLGREILRVIEEKKRVIIFTHNKEDSKVLNYFITDFCKGVSMYHITGSNDKTRKLMENFDKDDSEFMVMVATPLVAGMGLNLHSKFSNMIIINAQSFSETSLKQCEGRLNRIGQKNVPHIYYFNTTEFCDCSSNNVLKRYKEAILMDLMIKAGRSADEVATVFSTKCPHKNLDECTCLTSTFDDKKSLTDWGMISTFRDGRHSFTSGTVSFDRCIFTEEYDPEKILRLGTYEMAIFFQNPKLMFYFVKDSSSKERMQQLMKKFDDRNIDLNKLISFLSELFFSVVIGEINLESMQEITLIDGRTLEEFIKDLLLRINGRENYLIYLMAHTIRSTFPKEMAQWFLEKIAWLPPKIV